MVTKKALVAEIKHKEEKWFKAAKIDEYKTTKLRNFHGFSNFGTHEVIHWKCKKKEYSYAPPSCFSWLFFSTMFCINL